MQEFKTPDEAKAGKPIKLTQIEAERKHEVALQDRADKAALQRTLAAGREPAGRFESYKNPTSGEFEGTFDPVTGKFYQGGIGTPGEAATDVAGLAEQVDVMDAERAAKMLINMSEQQRKAILAMVKDDNKHDAIMNLFKEWGEQ